VEQASRRLPLILARELAANLATPLAIIDADGTLVFFNEPAQRIVDARPSEFGELTEKDWRARFRADLPDGTPATLDDMPTVRARRERSPAHATLVVTTLDGVQRTLEVTAIPLLVGDAELSGVVAVFWERESNESAG
jgi:PAS domain-containing protein